MEYRNRGSFKGIYGGEDCILLERSVTTADSQDNNIFFAIKSKTIHLKNEEALALHAHLAELLGLDKNEQEGEEAEIKGEGEKPLLISELDEDDFQYVTFAEAIELQRKGFTIGYYFSDKEVYLNPNIFTYKMINKASWIAFCHEGVTVINGKRGSGKTTEVIKQASKRNAMILVNDTTSRMLLEKQLKEMEEEVEVYSLSSILSGLKSGSNFHRKDAVIYIDEVDKVLHRLLHALGFTGKVVGYTTSGKVVELPKKE